MIIGTKTRKSCSENSKPTELQYWIVTCFA